MHPVLVFLQALFAVLTFASLIFFFLGYSVHKSMTVEYCDTWDYGNFNQFKKEFNSIEWEYDAGYNSYFSYSTNSKIHADIVRFRGKGMVLNFSGYFQYFLFKRKSKIKHSKRKKGLWSDSKSKPKLRIIGTDSNI